MAAIKTETPLETNLERIHVYLARVGVGSRREIEKLIGEGKVQVNAKPARLGQKISPRHDQIRIRGKNIPLALQQKIVVAVVYKPRGVVSTVKDPQGRPTVAELLPKFLGRLFPIGRLDLQSEGLLLMTNDGDLALQLTHPRYEIPKTYEVKIRGELDAKKIEYLKKGVRLGSEKFQPVEVLSVREATREGMSKYVVVVRIREGKNHHLRKLFDAVRCRVIRLKRIGMGAYNLKGLARGGYRVLSRGEIEKLREGSGL